MPSLFDNIGEFMQKNPQVISQGLNALGMGMALNRRTTDPNYHGNIYRQGLGQAGSMFLQQNRYDAATKARQAGAAEQKRQFEVTQAGLNTRAQATAKAKVDAAKTGGGFAGKGKEVQANRIYSSLTLKKRTAPLTPQEEIDLDLATRILTKPRIVGSPDAGFAQVPAMPLPTGQPRAAAQPAPYPSLPVASATRGKPLPTKVIDSLQEAQRAVRGLRDMDAALGETGIFKGQLSKAQVYTHPYLGSNPKAIKFDTAQKNLKLAAQALIKGIPSNFDVQTMINTIPAFGLSEEVNKSRLDFTRESMKDLVEGYIGYYKSLNYKIPAFAKKVAKDLNLDMAAIPPTQEGADPFQKLIDRGPMASSSDGWSVREK